MKKLLIIGLILAMAGVCWGDEPLYEISPIDESVEYSTLILLSERWEPHNLAPFNWNEKGQTVWYKYYVIGFIL